MNSLLLIDNRINDMSTIIQSLKPNTKYIIIDYDNDTYDSIINKINNISKIENILSYNNVGIFQENYELYSYQFVNAFENSVLENVEELDNNLDSWCQFKLLISYFKNILMASNIDLMGCNIHSNINSNIILTNVQNPFTNIFFSYKILIQLLEYIRLSNLLKISVNLNYEELANLSIAKQLEMKILTLFQRMDSLGNYTNIKWFNDLDKYGLILFIRELADIWNYRASLSQEIKREIVPPLGNPFYNGDINVINLTQYNFIQIKKYAIFIIDLMVNKGINENSCSLGSYYVLCALTLVSREAAEALPWLYEAVNYQ